VNFSPALRRIRFLIPVKTDVTPGERPLEPGKIALLRRLNPDLRLRHFGVLGRLDRYVLVKYNYEQSAWPRRAVDNGCAAVDWAALSIPAYGGWVGPLSCTGVRPRRIIPGAEDSRDIARHRRESPPMLSESIRNSRAAEPPGNSSAAWEHLPVAPAKPCSPAFFGVYMTKRRRTGIWIGAMERDLIPGGSIQAHNSQRYDGETGWPPEQPENRSKREASEKIGRGHPRQRITRCAGQHAKRRAGHQQHQQRQRVRSWPVLSQARDQA
jgi:hypothetical protein